MIMLRTIPYKLVWGPVALLIFQTWTQCSSRSHVHEFEATVGGFITITCKYDTYQYKNMGSSWCRQISSTECDNILHTRGYKPSVYNERVNVSQTMDHYGTVNVTISNLQAWDTGLYNWRVWKGNGYDILQTVLLQVVNGLPPHIHVARFKVHSKAEIHCEYRFNVKKSIIWYKKINENRRPWVAHSDGNKGTDYRSRVTVNHDEQSKKLTVIFQQLEVWDSGTYQCLESGSTTILTEILLIATTDNEIIASTMSSPTSFSRKNKRPLTPFLLDDEADGITEFSDLFPPLSSTLSKNNATKKPWDHQTQNKPWDILRWILFLTMALNVVFISYFYKSTGNIVGVRQTYKQPRKSQIRMLSNV